MRNGREEKTGAGAKKKKLIGAARYRMCRELNISRSHTRRRRRCRRQREYSRKREGGEEERGVWGGGEKGRESVIETGEGAGTGGVYIELFVRARVVRHSGNGSSKGSKHQ